MSRQYNIKWRVQDERELAQVARDFNRKLDRLIQENPKNASALPQFYNPITDQLESWLSIDTIKSLIKTRSDYNRMLTMLKRFMKEGAEEIIEAPGNEYGTKVTKWEAQEMLKRARRVNEKRAERLNTLSNLEMQSSEGELGYTLGERFGMGLASRVSLNPTNAFTPSQTTRDVHYKFGSLLKQSGDKYFNEKDKILKDNFIREIERNYAREDVIDVINAINNMDGEMFVLKFEAHGDGMEMIYPPKKGTEEYNAYLEELRRYWMNNNVLPPTSAVVSTLLNQ